MLHLSNELAFDISEQAYSLASANDPKGKLYELVLKELGLSDEELAIVEPIELPEHLVEYARLWGLYGESDAALEEIAYRVFEEYIKDDDHEDAAAEEGLPFDEWWKFHYGVAGATESSIPFGEDAVKELQRPILKKLLLAAGHPEEQAAFFSDILEDAAVVPAKLFAEPASKWGPMVGFWPASGTSDDDAPDGKAFSTFEARLNAVDNWGRCAIADGTADETAIRLNALCESGLFPDNIDFVVITEKKFPYSNVHPNETYIDDCGLVEWNKKQETGGDGRQRVFMLLCGSAKFSKWLKPDASEAWKLGCSLGLGKYYSQIHPMVFDRMYIEEDDGPIARQKLLQQGCFLHLAENSPRFMVERAAKWLWLDSRLHEIHDQFLPMFYSMDAFATMWVPFFGKLCRDYSDEDYSSFAELLRNLSVLPMDAKYGLNDTPVEDDVLRGHYDHPGQNAIVEEWKAVHPEDGLFDDGFDEYASILYETRNLAAFTDRHVNKLAFNGCNEAGMSPEELACKLKEERPELMSEIECLTRGKVLYEDVYPFPPESSYEKWNSPVPADDIAFFDDWESDVDL